MTTEHEYATYVARLASFETAVSVPIKKRTSNAKGTKSITWPHKSPSPEQLASAGFYYKPSVEAPDNTICYTCERQLDGWEEDDDPIVEHLKHSDRCGWAILTDVMKELHDVANMEDPTGSRIADARMASFQIGWPHEMKRGWVCKVEKMVQAGWHFAPTPESDDFVSCAYCKLSLDGWEPKDNPFDEHYRRSPNCPFFIFAGTTAPKAGKGKKGRTSKAARESNITVASEAPSIPDLNESIDTSTVSVLSTASTMGKGKNARGKAKAARHNKAEEPGSLQTDSSVVVIEDEAVPVKAKRGKKRGSEQISEDQNEREDTAKPEPPAKRRNTRTRNSMLQQVEYPSLEPESDALEVETLPMKAAKGGRKRASATTRSRKNSGASVASLRATVPEIAAIEAALASDLDKPLSDEEMAPEPEKPKRNRSKKATASKAPIRGKKTVSQEPDEQPPDDVSEEVLVIAEESVPNTKAPAKRGRKPKAAKEPAQKCESNESSSTLANNVEIGVESSMITAQTANDDSGHETDASVAGKRTKKGGRKKATTKVKGKKGIANKNIEDIVQKAEQTETAPGVLEEAADKMDVSAEIAVLNAEIEKEEAAAAVKPNKAAKGKKGKKVAEKPPHLSMPGAFSPTEFREESMEPSFMSAVASNTPPVRINAVRRAEGLETTDEIVEVAVEKDIDTNSNPEASSSITSTLTGAHDAYERPLTSDANITGSQRQNSYYRVPSRLGTEQRRGKTHHPVPVPRAYVPPLGDVTTTTRVQLNPGTPTRVPLSPSKIGGGIRSQVSWTEVDVDMIFAGTPGENEAMSMGMAGPGGELDEKEKAMSVQEWIYWNAGRAEENLKQEAERVVAVFEREGARAMGVLEGIECV